MEFKIDNKQIEMLKTVEDKTKEIYDYLSNNINIIFWRYVQIFNRRSM